MSMMENFTQRVTDNSTTLLIFAVILFFVNSLFTVDPGDPANAIILGTAGPAGNNLIYLADSGNIFSALNVLLVSFYTLFAALSFAAVSFDESKNIYFRVVAVAALVLILFGGLNLF